MMKEWSKTHNFCIWIKGFGINFYYSFFLVVVIALYLFLQLIASFKVSG